MDRIALTVPQAAEMAGIGRSFIYKLFSEGKLTPRKAGKRTLILFEELDAYVRALPKAGTSGGAK